MLRLILFFGFLSLGTLPAFSLDSAHAQKLYRCDGYVQHRPCDQVIGTRPAIGTTSIARAMPRGSQADAQYPVVLREAFRPVSGRVGNWHGEIKGKGKVTLRLKVFRNGNLESERFMGSVVLPKLKTTTFTFNSSMPQGRGWTWKVVAYAES